MSRIGIGNNVMQPDSRCMNCRYWAPARKKSGFMYHGPTLGFCKAGYCKKNFTNKNSEKRYR